MSFHIRTVFFFILTVGLGLTSQCGFSQNRKFHIDSLFPSNVSDTLNVREFKYEDWIYSPEGEYKLNALHGTQDNLPFYDASQVRNDLGNIGSANHQILYDSNRPFGFHFTSSRNAYWKHLAKRKLLVSDKMFSNVQYSNGVNRENYLRTNFTRGFGALLDLGFSFDRINSEGFYQRQRNTITDLSVYGAFRSKNSRYKASVMFTYMNLMAEENGGIVTDSVFEQNLTSGRSFINTNLTESSNHWKGFDFGLNHRLLLMNQDSAGSQKVFQPAISHSFLATSHSMAYRNVPDTASDYYENVFQDSSTTYDSTNVFTLSNTLRLELLKSDSVKSQALNRLAVGAQYDFHRVAYDSVFSEQIHNVSVLANVDGELFDKINWKASGNLMLYGYNIWDFKVDGQFDYSVGKSHFSAFVNYSLFRPDYITNRYTSNHFRWDNAWLQTQHLKTGLTYEQSKLRFRGSFTYHVLDNLVVFGTGRTPYQSASVNQLMVLRLQEHFRIKWFHIVLDGAIQLKLSGDDIRVPLALGRGVIYYQNDLFKKKLRIQVGVETSYSTAYYANGYNPALSAFHIQNDKQVGNYPFIDVFLNIRVKKLRAFFKVEHVNAGWLGYTYYHVPHYPVNDLAWKFGINWAFLD